MMTEETTRTLHLHTSIIESLAAFRAGNRADIYVAPGEKLVGVQVDMLRIYGDPARWQEPKLRQLLQQAMARLPDDNPARVVWEGGD